MYPQHRLTKVAGQWQRVRKTKCFIQDSPAINMAIDFVVAKTVPRQLTHTTINTVLFLEVS
jgi:ABC-type cobalamin transport system ATPase subunit